MQLDDRTRARPYIAVPNRVALCASVVGYRESSSLLVVFSSASLTGFFLPGEGFPVPAIPSRLDSPMSLQVATREMGLRTARFRFGVKRGFRTAPCGRNRVPNGFPCLSCGHPTDETLAAGVSVIGCSRDVVRENVNLLGAKPAKRSGPRGGVVG